MVATNTLQALLEVKSDNKNSIKIFYSNIKSNCEELIRLANFISFIKCHNLP